MATRTPVIERLEDRLSLTVDSLNSAPLNEVPEIFEGLISKVKLGSLFQRKWHENLRKSLFAADIEVTLDGKLSDEPRQMGNVIMGYEEDGYDYLTINAAAHPDSLITAARAAQTSGILVAIPPGQSGALPYFLDHIAQANDDLEDENQLRYLMCDVSDIAAVKSRGNFVVMATGIYVPDTCPGDLDKRMTPAEAIGEGADMITVGRAVVALHDRLNMRQASEALLENMATAL